MGSGFLSFFKSGRMSFLDTPTTTQNFFIHVLNSAGSVPSNFLSPRITFARFVEGSLVMALPPPVPGAAGLSSPGIVVSNLVIFVFFVDAPPVAGVLLLTWYYCCMTVRLFHTAPTEDTEDSGVSGPPRCC